MHSTPKMRKFVLVKSVSMQLLRHLCHTKDFVQLVREGNAQEDLEEAERMKVAYAGQPFTMGHQLHVKWLAAEKVETLKETASCALLLAQEGAA